MVENFLLYLLSIFFLLDAILYIKFPKIGKFKTNIYNFASLLGTIKPLSKFSGDIYTILLNKDLSILEVILMIEQDPELAITSVLFPMIFLMKSIL